MPKTPITEAPQQALELLRQAQGDPSLSEEIITANDRRWATSADMRTLTALQPHLPELPDSQVFGVYDRVREAEQRHIAPRMLAEDYREGTARFDNQLHVEYGGKLLLSAEHATDPPRKKGWGADFGTGGLAVVVAARHGADAIIPVGRQTSNAVSDPNHPVKHKIKEFLAPWRVGFVSLHGMAPNKVSGLLDESEIHAIVGLGTERAPSEATLAVVNRTIAQLKDELGLRVAIGNQTDFLLFETDPQWDGKSFRDQTDELQFGEDGLPLVNRLLAGTPNTTVNFVLRETTQTPLANMPNFQIELARSLCLGPDNLYVRDRSRAAMGVFLGYRLLRAFVDNTYAVSQADTMPL